MQFQSFNVLQFFSENMKIISADQLCFGLDKSWFFWISAVQKWKLQRCFREIQLWISAVQQCFSELWKLSVQRWFIEKQLWNRTVQLWLSYLLNMRFSALIYSETAVILLHEDRNIKLWKRSQKWWKCLTWSLKWNFGCPKNVNFLQYSVK